MPRTLWLKAALITSLCSLTPMSQAAMSLEILPASNSLRFPVPDAIYAGDVVANFVNLQITDRQGRNLPYAICALQTETPELLNASVTAVPDIARTTINNDGQLSLDVPKGARLAASATDWVIDLRHADAPIRQIDGLPPVRQMHSSPNLQQWSAAIRFRQFGDTLELDPIQAPFLRISLVKPRDTQDTPASLAVHLEKFSGQRARHWFSPEPDAQGLFQNSRNLPVLAARLQGESDEQAWTLESRQGAWDAWKSRGRISAGQTNRVINFSAVTDPQWRVSPNTSGQLELAHAAYELRIPQIVSPNALYLRVQDSPIFGPQLSCLSTQSLAQQAPREIRMEQTPTEATQTHGPTNLRNRFLVLLALVSFFGYFVWRFLKFRRDR